MCPSTLLTLMAKSRSSMTSLSPLLLFIFPVFFFFILLFPTCQVRVVRFYVSCPPPSSLLLLLVLLLAGPHLPALDRSGPRQTSTGQILSAVCLAGPQRLEKMSERMLDRTSEYQTKNSDRMRDKNVRYNIG